jgi:opacity protein-like surface antigen
MTHTFKLLLGVLAALAVAVPAAAQLSIDATAGYGIPAHSRSQGIWGGGLGVKHYLSPKLAVGARLRTYSEVLRESADPGRSAVTATTIPIMASVQYHPNDWDLHPYVGLELGIIRTVVNASIFYNENKIYDETVGDSSFGFAPKAGIGYDLSQSLAITGEVLYNIGFPKTLAGNTQLDLSNSSKFLTVHLGISYTFGNRFAK